jgi:hypothetical protein
MIGIKHALRSGEYNDLSAATVGKVITGIVIGDNSLDLHLEGGKVLEFCDVCQQCCESRYMTTDDKLEDYVGAQFVGAEIKDYSSMPGGDVHDVMFLEVQTTKGCFTIVNHVEHNGYYGGFDLEASLR